MIWVSNPSGKYVFDWLYLNTTNLSLIPLSRLVSSLFQICLRDSGNVLHWPHPQYSKVQVTLEASPQRYLWDVGHC